MNNRFTNLLVWNLLLLFPAHLFGQKLTTEHHLPHFCDSLEVYRMPAVEAGDSGRNCLWDFSELPIDSADVIPHDYYASSYDDTIHVGLHREHANYYMLNTSDTLWLFGYETSRTQLQYVSPMPLLRFPFAYGDSIVSTMEGTEQYCHSIPISIDGKTVVHADAFGRLILPDITIDSVLRVHSVVRYHNNASMQTQVQEERYQWYSVYCRYPLLEKIVIRTIANMDTSYLASTYYFPQEQKDMPSREHEQLENLIEMQDSLITNASYLPNPVMSDLNICYSLGRDALVYISLHYNGGVSTYQTPAHQEEEGEHSVTVNMAGMPTGNYVVYIHADDTIVSGNILKL